MWGWVLWVKRGWDRLAPQKQSLLGDSTARDAGRLRASLFIRDLLELMKHAERVIKTQTPTTAGRCA